jgi:hypothetical protein
MHQLPSPPAGPPLMRPTLPLFGVEDDFERGASYTFELVLENQSQRFGCVFELVEYSLAALG